MTISDHPLGTNATTNRKKGTRWTPPLMPVVLRIPRVVEEEPVSSKIAPRRHEYRWRVGVGAAILMLVAALPWLVRWHPPADPVPESLVSAIQDPDESDIELLPPLVAKATSSSAGTSENDNGMIEILDGLIVPPPSGGPQ